MRRLTILLGLAASCLGLVAPVAGAVGWTLVGTPLTAPTFQSVTYTFTATNLAYPNRLGCIEVQVPDSYVIDALGTPVMSGGQPWVSELYAGTNWVLAHATGGGGRLDLGESVTFTVQATATQGGAWDWWNHAHRQHDCTGADIEPGIMPMVVVPLGQPTPTPVPTPVPTRPPDPEPTVTPSPTVKPRPLPTPTPLPSVEVIAPIPAPPPDDPDGTPVGRMAPLSDGASAPVSLGPEVFALLDGPLVWFVPGAVVGVPGVLVLLFIALQAVGALAWLPAVRRMSGDPIPAQRRRRPGT